MGTSRGASLKRELSLPVVYAIATGVTMSSGFFLLPGIAFAQAGPAVILAYLIAAFPLIPGVLAKAELATAMPRAGGDYFFVDRTMGPLPGTVAGFGTWFALVLKTAFALVGMGAYLALLVPAVPFRGMAIVFAVVLGILNWLGVKKTGMVQVGLVVVLLVMLSVFGVAGLAALDPGRLSGMFTGDLDTVFATAAMVCVAYVGITKIASVAEEIHHPERTIPLAMFLALLTAMVLFVVGTVVMVGVLPPERLAGNLTPVAAAAAALFGPVGRVVFTAAALLAFVSVANAGVLSASRYPLAMARDHLVPRAFRFVGRRHTPTVSIVVTVAATVLCVALFDPTRIAKLTSAFQLLLFASNCLGVMVMRESRIPSYDPGYRSPLYPWLQIIGVVAPVWLIFEMGAIAVLFCSGLGLVGVAWYFHYGKPRVVRTGAVHHVFERWGRQRDAHLESELREIMKEKGLREEDPFDEVVARAVTLDLGGAWHFGGVVTEVAKHLAVRVGIDPEVLALGFLEGTRIGATPVARGAALPHLRSSQLTRPELVLVRVAAGLTVQEEVQIGPAHEHGPVYALFFLVSPEEDPALHLRLLAHIAGHVEDEAFLDAWLAAPSDRALKEILLREERYLSIVLRPGGASGGLIGRRLRDLRLPRGCLIAVVHRGDETIVPDGDTILLVHDRVTIIGEPRGVAVVAARFGAHEPAGPSGSGSSTPE